jgi:hypothetical protein
VGLAFLSKYCPALLGIACAVHILGWRRERYGFAGCSPQRP